jgi:hypothetical protein
MIPLPPIRAILVPVAVLAAFAGGWTLRGPVEARQAEVRLERCEADIRRAVDEQAIAWLVATGAVAAAQDIVDQTIRGGSREQAAEIRGYLTRGEP